MKPDLSLRSVEEERVVPWGDPLHFAWHRARYELAASFCAGKSVLDVGSGEGYGSAILAGSARAVLGVDYSPAAIEHSTRRYGLPNLSFEQRDARQLEGLDRRHDVIVCLEVIEHIENEDALLASLGSALHADGVLVLSTPNRLVDQPYSALGGVVNEYHINLLTPARLRRAASPHFDRIELLGQSVTGNFAHTALKALDLFNLRHRVVRSRQAQRRLTRALGQPQAPTELGFRFSALFIRQSPILILVARGRRRP